MNQFPEQLPYWRKSKGLSQLELALEAEVSNKHIRFLETGRAKPSREMVLLLSNILDLPLRNRNDLLQAAGFSEHYSRKPIDKKEMETVFATLELMLSKHEPFPAIVLDWDWNILMSNTAFQKLSKWLRSRRPNFSNSSNIVELIFDPYGFKPFIGNWEKVAHVTIQRLHRESMTHKNRHKNLLSRLSSYSDIPQSWKKINFKQEVAPMICLELETEDTSLKLITTLSSFGTPIDVTVEEIVVEQYFPADVQTKHFFENELLLLDSSKTNF